MNRITLELLLITDQLISPNEGVRVFVISSRTPSEAFASLLRHFHGLALTVSPRGMPCREEIDAMVMVAEPSDAPFTTANLSRDVRMAKYLEEEYRLYESGEDRVEEFAKHAKFWRNVTDGDRINSAYGRLVFFDRDLASGESPWQWAKRKLVTDPDTRQAVVQYLRPKHYQEPVKDLVCTCHCGYRIRGGSLHSTTVMRSNDLVRGFAYDVPWFMRCQVRMSRELGVPLGTYTHIAHSLHVYERDVQLVRDMLGV